MRPKRPPTTKTRCAISEPMRITDPAPGRLARAAPRPLRNCRVVLCSQCGDPGVFQRRCCRLLASPPGTSRCGRCTCRKKSGAPYTANAIWTADRVTIRGDTASWKDTTDARHFCPSCGSHCLVSPMARARSKSGLGPSTPRRPIWRRPMNCG